MLKMLGITRRRLILVGLIVFVGVGVAWFARPRDFSRELAISNYEEIRPGMSREQVETMMTGLPADTTYASMAGGLRISVSHRFNIIVHYDANGLLQRKFLVETRDTNFLPYSPWMNYLMRKTGYREYRQWP